MDGSTMAAIGSAGVAIVALWRSFTRESGDAQDKRVVEIVRLTVGEDLAILKTNVRRIMRKLDINGDE